MKKWKLTHYKTWTSLKGIEFRLLPSFHLSTNWLPSNKSSRESEYYVFYMDIYYSFFLFHGKLILIKLKYEK